MRDQKWFFGRASRNIRDQHVKTGRWLRAVRPHRVLVGDAGALIYASERPGLDIIGLGGYHALPFARAGVQGLTATIELMEHLHRDELPDLLAIYPSWWGILPTWFGGEVVARTPAMGNVICGGYEDVVYLADWHLLGTGEAARSVPAGLEVKDSVDIADLISETEHGYAFAAPDSGFTRAEDPPRPGRAREGHARWGPRDEAGRRGVDALRRARRRGTRPPSSFGRRRSRTRRCAFA